MASLLGSVKMSQVRPAMDKDPHDLCTSCHVVPAILMTEVNIVITDQMKSEKK